MLKRGTFYINFSEKVIISENSSSQMKHTCSLHRTHTRESLRHENNTTDWMPPTWVRFKKVKYFYTPVSTISTPTFTGMHKINLTGLPCKAFLPVMYDSDCEIKHIPVIYLLECITNPGLHVVTAVDVDPESMETRYLVTTLRHHYKWHRRHILASLRIRI